MPAEKNAVQGKFRENKDILRKEQKPLDSELQIDIDHFKQNFSEVIEQLLEQIRPILEAIKQAVSIILEKLSPIIEILKKFVDFFVNYPNRRAIHLALYAKRKRSRDKNRNRIIRDFFNSQIQFRSTEQ